MDHYYTAFGLDIRSELALPELIPSIGSDYNLRIRIGKADSSLRETTEDVHGFCIKSDLITFYWKSVGVFQIREGNEILIDPNPGVEERLIRLPLLGTVLAVLLQLKGLLVLHGSVVSVMGSGVAFLGGKGFGKSTMAATLHSRGHLLVADDIVALDLSAPNDPKVIPGFPQFKLWPDAAASIGENPETLPRLYENYDKRSRKVTEGFNSRPTSLAKIYLLTLGEAPEIEPLQPQHAIMQLICNTYSARYGDRLLKGKDAIQHLTRWSQLVNHIPVCWLKRPVSLEGLPHLAKMIEEDVVGNWVEERDKHLLSSIPLSVASYR